MDGLTVAHTTGATSQGMFGALGGVLWQKLGDTEVDELYNE